MGVDRLRRKMPLKRSGNTFRAGQTGPSSAEDASTMVSPPPQPSSGNAGAPVSAPSRAVNDAPSLASAPKLQFEGTLKAAPEMNRPIEMSKPPKAPLYEENGNGAGKGFGRKGKVYVNGEKVFLAPLSFYSAMMPSAGSAQHR